MKKLRASGPPGYAQEVWYGNVRIGFIKRYPRQQWLIELATEFGKWSGDVTGTKQEAMGQLLKRYNETPAPQPATPSVSPVAELGAVEKLNGVEKALANAQRELQEVLDSIVAGQWSHFTPDVKELGLAILGLRLAYRSGFSLRVSALIDEKLGELRQALGLPVEKAQEGPANG